MNAPRMINFCFYEWFHIYVCFPFDRVLAKKYNKRNEK
jgi:hypothetical protein